MIDITESEILDAIRDAAIKPDARPDGALTCRELSESIGLCGSAIRNRVGALIRSGAMECVWIKTTDMSGRVCNAPAYRMTGQPQKKAKR